MRFKHFNIHFAINEEVSALQQTKVEEKNQQERQRLIGIQTHRVYERIKDLAQDAVLKMGQQADIRSRVGDLEAVWGYTSHFEITRHVIPAIYTTVKYGPASIDIHRKVVPDVHNNNSWDHKESLVLDLDSNGNPFLTNKNGDHLQIEEAVRYILKPLIYPEMLGKNRDTSSSWSVRSH